jgi:glycogen operon protein
VASGVADGMMLCLFDKTGAETQIPMRDYDADIWHVFVPGGGAGLRIPGDGSLRPGPGDAL